MQYKPGSLVYREKTGTVHEVADGEPTFPGDVLVYVDRARIEGGLFVRAEPIPGRVRTELPATELRPVTDEDLRGEGDSKSLGRKVVERLRGVF